MTSFWLFPFSMKRVHIWTNGKALKRKCILKFYIKCLKKEATKINGHITESRLAGNCRGKAISCACNFNIKK